MFVTPRSMPFRKAGGVVLGIADLGISALAMYMLLPTGAESHFVAILVTFIFATLLGFASHAPGGIGPFGPLIAPGVEPLPVNLPVRMTAAA